MSETESAHDLYLLFSSSTGEGEEVHAPTGQPEGSRCGEELHVQQAHILYLQHGVEVSWENSPFSLILLPLDLSDDGHQEENLNYPTLGKFASAHHVLHSASNPVLATVVETKNRKRKLTHQHIFVLQ